MPCGQSELVGGGRSVRAEGEGCMFCLNRVPPGLDFLKAEQRWDTHGHCLDISGFSEAVSWDSSDETRELPQNTPLERLGP